MSCEKKMSASCSAASCFTRSIELALVHDDGCIGQMLVTADVVEVEMGVDERLHVARLVAAESELSRDRLFGRLLRQLERQDRVGVFQIEARVEQKQVVVVLDQESVGGDPHRQATADVPHQLGVV